MKKLIFLGILLLLLFLSFFSTFYLTGYLKPVTKIAEPNLSSQILNAPITINPTVIPSADSSQRPSSIPSKAISKKFLPILKILGSSDKLTKKENESMLNWRQEVATLAEKNRDTLYINGFTEEKKVALTFDDGPDLNITPKIIATLKENSVFGTFFFIGERVKLYPKVVKSADTEGNLVLSHSFTHPDFTRNTLDAIKKEVTQTDLEIKKITGKSPAILRPPYGAVNQEILDSLHSMQYTTVLWSIDTLDWSQMEKDNIVKNVIENIRPGDILLMHSNENKIATLQALPEIIAKLKEKGYQFVTVSDLLGVNPYR